ncbi:spermidine synthase [Tsuneonella sp. SYSU-LHT278]|uniref:spermidine synthase n=1 Tax=Tsuneonella sediminis TaxID=3416089 RepID=UPI003F79B090
MTRNPRTLFVATILLGSFLLFLVQPMVARMALPRLGGAPNVWNSAMLVYQALLLGGYAYAHALGRVSLRRQAIIHVAVLVLAALTLPIALADLPPAAPGSEVVWVPLLFLATIGPLFFAVSAQAPLMQRWYAAQPGAGDPYPLYAASNLGSFAGLIAYPLLAEPLLPIAVQSTVWAAGYAGLVVLVIVAGRRLPHANGGRVAVAEEAPASPETIGWRRIALWIALAAVPSGLMLSTTTFLTTDIVAMPLLWVIPLGLYLLSFSIAFAERRAVADAFARHAAALVMVLGSITILVSANGSMPAAITSIALLLVVAVALHGRLYESRPSPARLTLFYLVMSAGGVLGGAITALFAPLLFDWTWEHPLLIVAAALLVPLPAYSRWTGRFGWSDERSRIVMAIALAAAILAVSFLANAVAANPRSPILVQVLLAAVVVLALLVVRWRAAFAGILALSMLALGGMDSLRTTIAGDRSRSYFGIYTVRDFDNGLRTLAHGTTLHGTQKQAAGRELDPTSYYGRSAGVGLVLGAGEGLLGRNAKVGIVGLGVGTLACYKRPGQTWTFYEIDPAVLDYSRDGRFTFIDRCAPDARMVIGDARLELAAAPAGTYDVLAIDAFSSDAVPLHLLTDEAFKVYLRTLARDGLLLFHISNRYIDLAPALEAAARANGLSAILRRDVGVKPPLAPSVWIAMARDPQRLERVREVTGAEWSALPREDRAVWTDDYASILSDLNWSKFL